MSASSVASRLMWGVSALLLLTTSMVLASQGGVWIASPYALGACVYLWVEALPFLAALWLGAMGWGYPLRRAWLGDMRLAWVAQALLGMSVQLILGYVLGMAGGLNPITAWGLCALGMALGGLGLVRASRGKPARDSQTARQAWPWTIVLAMPGLGLLLVAATCPPGTLWQVEAFGYDVLSYHLQIPREWMAQGQMTGLTHNVYSYLPGLIESGFYQLALMRGSVEQAIYLCQLFSVSWAVSAALGIGGLVAQRVGATAGGLAGAVFLSLPWVLITGSLAYNEMAVCALGAGALLVLFQPAGQTWRGAMAVGLLVGSATLCKLTAGPMLAAPVGVVMLLQLHRPATAWRRGLGLACVAGAAGLLTLSPYLVRNLLWTGNPVFPFAATSLGQGHWNSELVTRWDAAHGLANHQADRGQAIVRQWLLNTGYGAAGGFVTPRETQNIARFPREGGLPIFWISVVLSVIGLQWRATHRRMTWGLLALMAMGLAFWLARTHLQSRFLIPTLVPACVLLGWGAGAWPTLCKPRRQARFAVGVLGAGLVAGLTFTGWSTLQQQTRTFRDEQGHAQRTPVWMMIDALGTGRLDHPINALPPGSRTLVVADVGSLLYLRSPIGYHTAFDADELGQILRQAHHDPQHVNALLRDAGYTHVWIGWSELHRLRRTYGHDPQVTSATLQQLIRTGWRPVAPQLYVLPSSRNKP